MAHYIQSIETKKIEPFEDHELPDGCIVEEKHSNGRRYVWYVFNMELYESSGDEYYKSECASFNEKFDYLLVSIRDKEGNLTHRPEWMWKVTYCDAFISLENMRTEKEYECEKVLVWVEFGGKE